MSYLTTELYDVAPATCWEIVLSAPVISGAPIVSLNDRQSGCSLAVPGLQPRDRREGRACRSH